MKRLDLARHLRVHGCFLAREGGPRHLEESCLRQGCTGSPAPRSQGRHSPRRVPATRNSRTVRRSAVTDVMWPEKTEASASSDSVRRGELRSKWGGIRDSARWREIGQGQVGAKILGCRLRRSWVRVELVSEEWKNPKTQFNTRRFQQYFRSATHGPKRLHSLLCSTSPSLPDF